MATGLDPLSLLTSAYQDRPTDITEIAPGAFGKKEDLPISSYPLQTVEGGSVFDVGKDYGNEGGQDFTTSPSWCIAIFRLGSPITYSRLGKGSISTISPVAGVISRKEKPLIITSECIQMSVSGSKDS